MYPILSHRSLARLCNLILCIFFFTNVFSQKTPQQLAALKQLVLADEKVKEVALGDDSQTPSFIVFEKATLGYKTAEVPALFRKYLPIRNGYDNMVEVKRSTLFNDVTVPEYQQFFKGIKVEFSHYKALAKAEDVQFMAGSFYEVPTSISSTPGITENQALQFAKSSIGAERYAWEDVQAMIAATGNQALKAKLTMELQEYLPNAELVIIKDFTQPYAVMRLAYKFNLYASKPLSRGYIYVDAQNGKILLYNAIIKHASVPTTVTTRYAGSRTIYTKQISGNDPNNGALLVSSHPATEPGYVPGSPTYVLHDDTRGNGVVTYDANNVQGLPITLGDFVIYAQGKSFTDVDNNWTLPEHKRAAMEGGANEAENDDIAWDAHWGAGVVYDYWKNRQNRLSFDGNNAPIISYVHYGPAYDNAFWNGRVMTYGDGSGNAVTGFKALTSLDVCAHEIGHGVCSNTSDLVYQGESGAMNEGLSDIWAACVENYAIKTVDPTLNSRYKPFYIGEQIGYGTDPSLRRMDNPKAKTDPDTYGGQYFSNPNCTPTAANDQCGVHTNSGVLNKWFYLLTVGSGAGSGPDASYVIPGADDGLRDSNSGTVVLNSVPYSVTGLGFNLSERITFIMETMLTSTATFAEARSVSIAAATALSGDACGSAVQSVTNAWHAVGVGSAFSTPCVSTFGFTFQSGTTVAEGLNTFGCAATRTVNVPVLLPPNSTANVTLSGTATNGIDYVVTATSFSNTGSSARLDTIRVIINNDAVVESTETIIVNTTMTNTGANPTNNSYTITILDDDAVPVIGSDSITLINENFDSYTAQGFAGPNTWQETLELAEGAAGDPAANGKNQWGVLDGTLSITGRLSANGTGTLPAGNYYNTSVSQTRIAAPQVDARGLNNLKIKFDYTLQGEIDPNGVDPEQFGKFDYMEILYTIDGVNFISIDRFASASPVSGTYNTILPAALNNKQFTLVFRWVNDTNAGGPVSVKVDNLTLKGVPRKIESQLAHSANEKAGANQDIYLYSQNDGEIITRINNTSSFDFGCVTASIEKAGNSSFNLYTEAGGENRVGDKIVRVTPANVNPSGAYSISLYFTEQEIQAIQTATGAPRTSFFMYKTSAANFATATSANTQKVAAAYTAIPGAGGIFTASFSTGFSAFAVGALVSAPLPVTCIDFTGTKAGNVARLQWKVSEERNNSLFTIERSSDGITFNALGTVAAQAANRRQYTYEDATMQTIKDVYYRLKQTDANGDSKFICSVVYLRNGGKIFNISAAYPNPVKGDTYVKITSNENTRINIDVMNSIGQLMNSRNERILAGTTNVTLPMQQFSAGTYMVRFTDDKGNILNAQTIVVR